MAQRPFPDGVQNVPAFVAGHFVSRLFAAQHPGIRISHDDRAIHLPQARYDFSWLRPALDGVAETNHLIHWMAGQILQNLIKGDAITSQLKQKESA